MADERVPTIAELTQEFSEQFDAFCQMRHEVGQEKYGEFTFFEKDLIKMMVEELADMANYARYQYIKLMFLQGLLEGKFEEEGLAKENGEVTIGVKSFKRAGE